MNAEEREAYAAEARRAYAERKAAAEAARTERLLVLLRELDEACDWRRA